MTHWRKRYILASGLIGATLLCSLSALQKLAMGWGLAPQSFVAPFTFGFVAGILIGCWHSRVLQLKQTLDRAYVKQKKCYQDIVTTAPLGIFQSTPEGRFRLINDQLATVLGFEKNELLEGHIGIKNLYVNPKDREEVLRRLKRDKSLNEYPIHLRRKDGSTMWVSLFVTAREDEEGTYFDGFMLDITERKHAGERITVLGRILDASPVCISIHDTDGRFLYANAENIELHGYDSLDEFLQINLHELDVPESEALLAERFRKIAEEGEARFESCHFRKDGSIIPLEIIAQKIEWEGRPAVLSIASDISERKDNEERLLQAKEAAEVANQTKSEFLANMSHEIRTPLNGLMGMLQLLKTTDQDTEQIEYTDTALQSSRRLLRLLSDILDLSKVEAGKMNIVIEPFDFKDTINAVVQLFSPTAMEKQVNLSGYIDPNIPSFLCGDAARIQQVLSNLVGNSIKFSQKGHIELQAHPLPPRKDDEYRILFSVSDTGIGMPEELLEKLFAPFTQAEQSYNRSFQGAGLGLSISKRLVELMGGTMAVESEEGIGSTIYFCIPFKLAEHNSSKASTKAKLTALTGLKILMAEDDETSRLATARHLEKNGHQIDAAIDGKQVLRALKEKSFDLVLMDIQMPVMDGIETTTAIRQGKAGKENQDILIIAMTAYAMAGDKEKFLKAGMNGYVSKPVDMAELQKVMSLVLEKILA